MNIINEWALLFQVLLLRCPPPAGQTPRLTPQTPWADTPDTPRLGSSPGQTTPRHMPLDTPSGQTSPINC